MAANEVECPSLHHIRNKCAEYKRIEKIKDNQLENLTLVFCLQIERNNEIDSSVSMAWEVINPKCQRKIFLKKKVVGAHGNHQVYLSLISKSQQVCEEGSLQVEKNEHSVQKSQCVRMTIKTSTWKNDFNVNFVRVRLLMNKNHSQEGGGSQSNKFSIKEDTTMKCFLWSSENELINENCTCHDGKQSSGRYKDAVRTDQDRIFYFKCLFIKNDGENMAPKSNPGEKEETSADTVFFMKKICSASNKFIVSNQQVLKTPAREGDMLKNEKVKDKNEDNNALDTSTHNFKNEIESNIGSFVYMVEEYSIEIQMKNTTF